MRQRARTIVSLVAITGCLVAALATAVGACGGDDNAPSIAAEDGSTRANPTSSSTSGGSSSGAGEDAVAPPDDAVAGEDAVAPPDDAGADADGGAVALESIPGKVACAAEECDASLAEVCCAQISDAGVTETCRAVNKCSASQGDYELHCDESADCVRDSGVHPCCFTETSHSYKCFTNSTSCGAFVQMCQTNAECGDAGPCHTKKCGSLMLNVCGSPAGCE